MRTLLSCLLIHAAAWLHAQQVNVSYHDGKETSFGAVTLGSCLYYLEHSKKLNTCCSKDLNLVKVKNGGQVIFRKKIGNWGYALPPLLKLSADDHLIIADGTEWSGCDVGPIKYSVLKVDTTGTVKWEKKLGNIVSHMQTLGDTGLFLVFVNDELHKWDSQGNVTFTAASTMGTITAVSRYGPDSFLVNHINGGGSNLRKYGNDLQPASDVLIGASLSKMLFYNNTSLLALSGGVLKHYTRSFAFVSNSNITLNNWNYPIRDFCIENDTVFCTGKTMFDNLFYMSLDTSLSPVNTWIAGFHTTNPTAIAVMDNRINILGTGRSHVYATHSYIDLIQTAKNGSITPAHDVGVTSFTITNATLDASAILLDALVTVKNFGNQTVSSFHLNSYMNPLLHDCIAGLNREINATILPGDSVSVPTGTFLLAINNSLPAPVFTLNLCLFTTVPEKQSDAAFSNDQRCQSSTHVGIGERAPSFQFLVFPNPVKDLITVQAAAVITSVEILDAEGRVFYNSPVNNSDQLTIRNNLPPGFYLMCVRADDHVAFKKLIIE